jgi:hypothetical protein
MRETDVCHESIKGHSVRMLSISRACRLEGTTPRFRCAAIRGRGCNFSMDQVEQASVEYLSATYHLFDDLNDFGE